MYRKTFHLIQHTPLIHFQHDQAGATLRATEVKPKLDRYIIREYKGGWEDIPATWKAPSGTEDYRALNYRMTISAAGSTQGDTEKYDGKPAGQFAGYFADMGKSNGEVREVVFKDVTKVTVQSVDQSLVEHVTRMAASFFSEHNFGMRQSFGFGNFTTADGVQSGWALCFNLDTADQKDLFRYLDLFQRTYRRGLNCFDDPTMNRKEDGRWGYNERFYMKPLIFKYAADSKIAWEKRAIKVRFKQERFSDLDYRRDRRYRYLKDAVRNKRGNKQPERTALAKFQAPKHLEKKANYLNMLSNQDEAWPITISTANERLVRSVLGLSNSQKWMGYDFGGIEKEPTSRRGNIERAPAPFTYVPVRYQNRFIVYVYAYQPHSRYLREEFRIKPMRRSAYTNNKKIIYKAFTIKGWDTFNMKTFLERYFNQQTIHDCIVPAHRKEHKQLYNELCRIYYQIEKSLQPENVIDLT